MSDDSLPGRLADEFTHRVREGQRPDIEDCARRIRNWPAASASSSPTLMLLEGMAAADARPAQLSPGAVFGNYRIEREIGRGGMLLEAQSRCGSLASPLRAQSPRNSVSTAVPLQSLVTEGRQGEARQGCGTFNPGGCI
jgi:hypothetical protein